MSPCRRDYPCESVKSIGTRYLATQPQARELCHRHSCVALVFACWSTPPPFVCAMAWLCVVYLSVLILNSTSISRTKISSDVTQLDNAIRLIWPCHGVCCWPVRVRALTSHLSTTCLECLWSACPLTSLLCRTFLRTRLQQRVNDN
jgi:hypothetical protein